MEYNKIIKWGIFLLLSIIWGSSFILMKYSNEGLTASQIAAVRIFSAGLVFMPFMIFHISKIPQKKIPLVILTGILGNLIPAFLFAEAIANNIDSSLAAILNSLTPICVIVTGIVFFGSVIKKKKIIGVIIGFIGLCLLFITKGIYFHNFYYALLVLLATLSYGFNVNIVSKWLGTINPFHIGSVSLGFLPIPMAIVLWQQHFFDLPFNDPVIKWSVIASVILGIVASSIASTLFYILVNKAGGLFASLVTYGIPVIAIFWGLVFGEEITLLQTGCLGVILCGVYLANKN